MKKNLQNHWGIYCLVLSLLLALVISNQQVLVSFYGHLTPKSQGALSVISVVGLIFGSIFACIMGAVCELSLSPDLSDAMVLGEVILVIISLLVGIVSCLGGLFFGLMVGSIFFVAMNITYFPTLFLLD